MAEADLIPFNTMTVEQQKKIASMGGKVSSPKKKLAAKLRELKKKGMTNDTAKQLAGMMEDPDLFGLDLLMFLKKWSGEVHSAGQAANMGNTLINLHKAIHGEKIKSENTNVNINLNIDMLKFQQLAEKYSEQ